MYVYPESGHGLEKKEHIIDAYLNMNFWMNKYL